MDEVLYALNPMELDHSNSIQCSDGACEVSASCSLVSVAHRHILFDCQMHMKQRDVDSLQASVIKQRKSVNSCENDFVVFISRLN